MNSANKPQDQDLLEGEETPQCLAIGGDSKAKATPITDSKSPLSKVDKVEGRQEQSDFDEWEVVDSSEYQMGGTSCGGVDYTGHIALGSGKWKYEKDWKIGFGHSPSCRNSSRNQPKKADSGEK